MKKLVIALALVPAIAMADLKIGTVEIGILIRNHKRYETNKRFLDDSEKESQARLESMRKDLEKVQADGQKIADEAQNPMLAAGRRQELEKRLMEIQKKLISGQQALRGEAMRAQQDLQSTEAKFQKIMGDDLRKVISDFAATNGYDLVIDSSAVPYSSKSMDVTDGVLKLMGVDPAKAVKPVKEEGKKSDEGK